MQASGAPSCWRQTQPCCTSRPSQAFQPRSTTRTHHRSIRTAFGPKLRAFVDPRAQGEGACDSQQAAPGTDPAAQRLVRIDYHDLVADKDLSAQIEEASNNRAKNQLCARRQL